MIPRVVHRCWFGPHPMRRELIDFGRAWESFGYDVQHWTEKNLPELANQEDFDDCARRIVNAGGGDPRLGTWVQQADIASYELVYMFGGIYANTDIEPLRPLDDLLDGVTAFAGSEDGTAICNALMGATQHHPFFDAAAHAVHTRLLHGKREPMNLVTGPKLLTDLQAERGDLTVFEQGTFYPFGYLEMDREHDDFPNAYTKHRWGHTRGRWSTERQVV